MSDQPPAQPSGILPSNVDSVVTPDAQKPSPKAPVGWLLVAILTFVVGVAVTLVITTPRNAPAPQVAAPAAQSAPTTPAQRAPQSNPVGAPFPAINGISCDALESTIVHIHVHLAVFFDDEEQ